MAQRGLRVLGGLLGGRGRDRSTRDGWASFLAAGKLEGYRVDMGPATHPIRGEVPDVSQAMANFDAISYLKGQSVLKQLSAYVGEDAFLAGLQGYFGDHAWGNTRLEDLIDAIGAASGEDLQAWQEAWLQPVRHRHPDASRGHAERCRARR